MRCSLGKQDEDRAAEYGQKEDRSKYPLIKGTAGTSVSLECRAQAGIERGQK